MVLGPNKSFFENLYLCITWYQVEEINSYIEMSFITFLMLEKVINNYIDVGKNN